MAKLATSPVHLTLSLAELRAVYAALSRMTTFTYGGDLILQDAGNQVYEAIHAQLSFDTEEEV